KVRQSYDPCTQQHSLVYFNSPEVHNALHVYQSNNTLRRWEICSDVVEMFWKDSPTFMLDIYHELIMVMDALNLTTINPWHAWYEDDQVIPSILNKYTHLSKIDIGTRTQTYERLTYVTVNGARHEVPLHKPKQALALINSFLAGTSMAPSGQ
ncbi:Peptidase S10, serine carboxypeptidase, partial [Cynara cardunculus var. scolymus]